jgi:hypothetical protein
MVKCRLRTVEVRELSTVIVWGAFGMAYPSVVVEFIRPRFQSRPRSIHENASPAVKVLGVVRKGMSPSARTEAASARKRISLKPEVSILREVLFIGFSFFLPVNASYRS